MAKDLSDVQTTVAVVVGGEKNRGDQSERTHQDEGAREGPGLVAGHVQGGGPAAARTVFLQPYGDDFLCEWSETGQQQYVELALNEFEGKPAKVFFGRVQSIVLKEKPGWASHLTTRVRIHKVGNDRGQIYSVLSLQFPPDSPEAKLVGDLIKALGKEVARPTPKELLHAISSSIDTTDLKVASPSWNASTIPTTSSSDDVFSFKASSESESGERAKLEAGGFADDAVEHEDDGLPSHLLNLPQHLQTPVVDAGPALAKALSKTENGRNLCVLQDDGRQLAQEHLVVEKRSETRKLPLATSTYKFVALDLDGKCIKLMLLKGRKKTLTVKYDSEKFREKLELAFFRLTDLGGDAFERCPRAHHVGGVALIQASVTEESIAGKAIGYSLDDFQVLSTGDA